MERQRQRAWRNKSLRVEDHALVDLALTQLFSTFSALHDRKEQSGHDGDNQEVVRSVSNTWRGTRAKYRLAEHDKEPEGHGKSDRRALC